MPLQKQRQQQQLVTNQCLCQLAKLHCIATDAAAYQTKKKECETTVRREYILIVVLFSSLCTDRTEHWQSALCRHFFFFGLL